MHGMGVAWGLPLFPLYFGPLKFMQGPTPTLPKALDIPDSCLW